MLIDANNKQAIQIIENYSVFSTKFSLCSECGENTAKGGMHCKDCLEDELSEIVGYEKAK